MTKQDISSRATLEAQHNFVIAALLNDEVGAVSGEFMTDGATYFNAVFSLYGGEFSWIPAAVCTVTAVADLAQ